MKLKFKQLAWCISLAICPFISYEQALQPQNTESPWLDNNHNGNSLSGNLLSKNLFTGTATVSIPFWSYSIGGINLSVGMAYDTHGIQVDRIASEIGLGWELYTGGYIERETRGLEDDIDVDQCGSVFYVPYPRRKGYWIDNPIDEEPDVFYASFGGRSIKFLFSKNGNLLTIPLNNNIKIERYIDGSLVTGVVPHASHTGNLTFTITDEKGNKFYYKIGKQYTKTNVYDLSSLNLPNCTQTYSPVEQWVLDKIVTYEGKEVDYNYENITVHLFDHKSQNFWEQNNNYGETHETNVENDYSISRIKSIVCPNNIALQFQYDNTNRCDLPGSNRLKTITVTEGAGTTGTDKSSYSYSFNHSYFNSPSSNTVIADNNNNEVPLSGCSTSNTLLRLKLNSIDLVGKNNQSQIYYTFKYNTMPLPERLYGARDLYGYANNSTPQAYNNGNGGNYLLTISKHSFSNTTYPTIGMDNTVSTNVSYPKACILEKVINGKNGELDISYAANTNNISGVGGLHIDWTAEYDGYNHDNDVVKTYEYADGARFESEGNINYYIEYEKSLNANDFNSATLYTNSGNVLNTSLNGSNYGFKKVTEYIKNSSGNQVGKSIYYFSGTSADPAINNGTDDNFLNPNFTTSSSIFFLSFGTPPFSNRQYIRDWGIGLPLKVESYDNNNNLLSTRKSSYSVSEILPYLDEYKSVAHLAKRTAWQGGALQTYDEEYYPFTGETYLLETIDNKYVNGNKNLQSTVDYTYDSKGNLSSTKTTNSLGEQMEIRNHYSYDWLSSTVNPGSVINKLNQDKVQSMIYSEKWHNYNYNGVTDNYLLGTSVNSLQILSGNIIRPVSDYHFQSSTPVASSAFSDNTFNHIADINAGNTANYLLKNSTITKFDDQGYSLEQNDISGNYYTASIWDNQTGSKLAEVANARYQDIAYCGFESNYSGSPDYKKGNWEFNNSGITTAATFLGRFSYNLTNNGAWTTTNLTVGKKYTVSFWLYQGGSADVNDGVNPINIPSTGISYNGWTLYQKEFVAQGNGIGMWGNGYVDELRLYPSNAAMSNYNYLPLIGKTSVVDPNNKFMMYEYDDFGNLVVERDQNGNVIHKYKNVTQGND